MVRDDTFGAPIPVVPVKPNAETVVVPTNGVMPLKTLDDWRALFHQIVPIIVTTLVGINLVTNDQATLWVPFVFAVADNILSVGNTADRVRRAVQASLLLLQSGSAVGAIVSTVVENSQAQSVTMMTTAGITILSTIISRFYTPTSSVVPK